jgi:hypothetical protein
MCFMQAIGMISEENLEKVNGWLQVSPAQDDKAKTGYKVQQATQQHSK